jgi:transposase, IS5 family
MRPRERQDSGQHDLFKARLDQIADLRHPLARLARTIGWGFLEKSLGSVCSDGPGGAILVRDRGGPPLATRLRAGFVILKHMHDRSGEVLCGRWIENPYDQLFCGEEFFRRELPLDRSSLTRWRQRMGEEKLPALLPESLSAAARTGAAKPSDFPKARLSGRRQADAPRAGAAGAARQEAGRCACANPARASASARSSSNSATRTPSSSNGRSNR